MITPKHCNVRQNEYSVYANAVPTIWEILGVAFTTEFPYEAITKKYLYVNKRCFIKNFYWAICQVAEKNSA